MCGHAHYQSGGMGHVDQQQYKSFAVQNDDHFAVVCRYVEGNALRAGYCLVPRAGAVALVAETSAGPPVPVSLATPAISSGSGTSQPPLYDQELTAVR